MSILARIRKLNSKTFRFPYKKIMHKVNLLGNAHQCYLCNKKFDKFHSFRGGAKNIPDFISKLDVVGSDVENFACPVCGANDRIRHLFMFFDRLDIWDKLPGKRLLHIAPEPHLAKKISQLDLEIYIKGDLYPWSTDIKKVDITKISYSDNYFDAIFCNHVLEHVHDFKKAISEFYRVLKPGGFIILQTPYSNLLMNNFQDPGINSDELRLFFYEQEDHVRLFSKVELFHELSNVGFIDNTKKHSDCITSLETYTYGVNPKEDLLLFSK